MRRFASAVPVLLVAKTAATITTNSSPAFSLLSSQQRQYCTTTTTTTTQEDRDTKEKVHHRHQEEQGHAKQIVAEMQASPTLTHAVAKYISREDIEKLNVSFEAQATALSGAENPSAQHGLTPFQWRALALRSAAPYFGFGVCDNIIMICVGDAIDASFGVTMGFSTLVAAGFGQAVSDGSGVTIQSFIERWADRLRLPNPHLTEAQRNHPTVMTMVQIFRTIGIVIGCLIALGPVIFFDTGNAPRLHDMILKVIPEERRRAVAQCATQVAFQPDESILQFDADPDAMFTIVSGEVRVVGRDKQGRNVEITTLERGESVGFVELVFDHKCVADVIANTKVRTHRIDKKDFQRYILAETQSEDGTTTPTTGRATSSSSSSSKGGEEARRVVRQHIEQDNRFATYRMNHGDLIK